MRRLAHSFKGLIVLLPVLLANAWSGSEETDLIGTTIAAVNIDSLMQTVRELSGETEVVIDGQRTLIASRYRTEPGNALAARYLLQRLSRYGLPPQIDAYGTMGENVVAVQRGVRYPNRYYVICAHYDAMPPGPRAYGADDNASGTAAVLECARLLGRRNLPYSVIYALWDEEEAGLIGSRNYAMRAAARGDSILGVINMDMIAYDGNDDGLVNLHVRPIAASLDLGERLMEINANYKLGLLTVMINPGSSASDHAAFWEQNYSAVMVIEDLTGFSGSRDFNPFYHTLKDRIAVDGMQIFNTSYFLRCARVSLGGLMSLALEAHPAAPVVENTSPVVPVRTFFTWRASEWADHYWVQLALDSTFTAIACENRNLYDTLWIPPRLAYNTAYHWRVRAQNRAGSSAWSANSRVHTGTPVERSIPLHAGWNLVSSPVAADDSSLTALIPETSGVSFYLRDGAGRRYAPDQGLAERTLWHQSEGYWMHLSRDAELSFRGYEINTAPTALALAAGWHIVPYWRNEAMATSAALQSIQPHLLILKDEQGRVCWPEAGIDQVPLMTPGKAYQVCLRSAALLSLPLNALSASKPGDYRIYTPSHYQPVAGTGNNATLLIDTPYLNDGDEIGIRSGGRLVGAGAVREKRTLITLWGDDEISAAVEGATAGEVLNATVWNAASGSEQHSDLDRLVEVRSGASLTTPLRYERDGIWMATVWSKPGVPRTYSLAQNYPNPFNRSTVVTWQIPATTPVRLVLYNERGQRVRTLIDARQNPGSYRLTIDAGGLASGIYWLALEHPQGSEAIKMVLLR